MTNDVAIKLENVSKTFVIREQSSGSIRDHVLSAFGPASGVKEIKALQDINLEIKKGEFFGVIGRNGSGKSTLLKMILGTLRPDKGGVIEVNGVILRLALGMGFDGNLSARDNIYLNGSIIGLTFHKIGEIFDEIIAFSELEEYVDTAVKYFSSGMRSRLAFSIAVHAEADVLLIDEFFGGVGDLGFKEKSEAVFKSTVLKERTIIYVSHQLQNIINYCQRVIVLEGGSMTLFNNPIEAVDYYRSIAKKTK
jgi:ABC-type polysaccharide/polyol phosphate transport system ATPase subunit